MNPKEAWKHKEDARIRCHTADGGGDRAMYLIDGVENVVLEYEMYDPEEGYPVLNTHPWTPNEIRHGRLSSGFYYCFESSTAAVDYIESGQPLRYDPRKEGG